MTSLGPLIRKDTLIGGKYRLGPAIGSGGVATVYRATHLWTERGGREAQTIALQPLNPSVPPTVALSEATLPLESNQLSTSKRGAEDDAPPCGTTGTCATTRGLTLTSF